MEGHTTVDTNNTTHVLAVIDASGSMFPLAMEVRSGFNGYIAELREARAERGLRFQVSVTTFNHRATLLCTAAPLDEVPELTEVNYAPASMTSLLDAVGATIAAFDREVPLVDWADGGDRVQLVIMTDGQENMSSAFTWDQIREVLEARAAAGWQITYLGQGVNAWAQGARFGGGTVVIASSDTAEGTRAAYQGMKMSTVDYAVHGDPDRAADILRSTAQDEEAVRAAAVLDDDPDDGPLLPVLDE